MLKKLTLDLCQLDRRDLPSTGTITAPPEQPADTETTTNTQTTCGCGNLDENDQAERDALQKELEGLQKEKQELVQKRAVKQGIYDARASDIEDLKKDLAERERQLAASQDNYKQFLAQHPDWVTSTEEGIKAQGQRLRTEVTFNSGAVTNAKLNIAALEGKNAALKDEIKKMDDRLKQIEDRIAAINDRLAELDNAAGGDFCVDPADPDMHGVAV